MIESVVIFLVVGVGLGVYCTILFSVDPFGVICRANEKQNDSLRSDLEKERSEKQRLEQDVIALKKQLADAENIVRTVRLAVQTEAVFRPWVPKSGARPVGIFTDGTFAQVGS